VLEIPSRKLDELADRPFWSAGGRRANANGFSSPSSFLPRAQMGINQVLARRRRGRHACTACDDGDDGGGGDDDGDGDGLGLAFAAWNA